MQLPRSGTSFGQYRHLHCALARTTCCHGHFCPFKSFENDFKWHTKLIPIVAAGILACTWLCANVLLCRWSLVGVQLVSITKIQIL
eukprot:6174278-Pleurochrysis_carterae.AAC.1